MQEVKFFLDGERNYYAIKGDTGPLVYPAGFLYFFSILYYITSNGQNIRAGLSICSIISITLFSVLFCSAIRFCNYLLLYSNCNTVYLSNWRKDPGLGLGPYCFVKKDSLHICSADVQ